jgi:hypothetical protein
VSAQTHQTSVRRTDSHLNTQCREELPEVDDVGKLIDREPRLLKADVKLLLSEVRRLMPNRDPQQFLADNPTVCCPNECLWDALYMCP